MTERVQLATNINPEIKRMLKHMCADDLISLREQLEHLIREEHNRRNAPHNKSIDERVAAYIAEKEPA